MRIKNHKNKNSYLLSEDGLWIRDFTKKVKPLDINNLSSKKDCEIYLENETRNTRKQNLFIDSENSLYKKAVIVSDGLGFQEKQIILSELSHKDVAIIGVNGSLASWKMVGNLSDKKRIMNFYFINNPYKEATYFLPKKHKYFPRCIASTRTNNEFINSYLGNIYYYSPTVNEYYAGLPTVSNYKIDDYRNPICGAISFCYKLGVKKLLLFCCDDSFKEEKPGSLNVNGTWCYPQQLKSNAIIDSCLYWLKQNNVEITYHCSGVNLKNATYIKHEDVTSFFKDYMEETKNG